MSSSCPYSYEPLVPARPSDHESSDEAGADNIRILAIKPGDFDDPLCCNLDIISILDCPVLRPYEALSYVWGDAGIKHAILVNGQELSITTNLEVALRRLRQPYFERTLWADAICIDQSNIEERGAQVQLMSRIYQGAFCVIIWLGKADEDTDIAFDTAKRLEEVIKGDSIPPNPRLSRSRLEENHFTDRQIDCFIKVFNNNTWFTRIWCVQEFVYGKSAKLVCGHRSMSWTCLVLGTQVESCQTLSTAEKRRLNGINKRADGLQTIKMCYGYPITAENRRYGHFANFIQFSSEMNSTDPRDKIYALLGLSEFAQLCFTPDYERSLSEICLAATKCIIFESKTLNVLCSYNYASILERELLNADQCTEALTWFKGLVSSLGQGMARFDDGSVDERILDAYVAGYHNQIGSLIPSPEQKYISSWVLNLTKTFEGNPFSFLGFTEF